ncbi:hypothetical protein AAG906_020954 [Vitis piasezkii]
MVISIQPTIPFFEGNGYDTWSIKMRTLFISEDLWELVDKGYVEEEIPRDAMRDDAAQDGDGSQTDIPLMDDSVYEAAAKGDIEALKKIPESEFHAQLSPKHNTILHIASEFGKIECVNWILDFPSSSSLLQRPNLNEDTPLHLAAREGHLDRTYLDIETGPGPHKVMLRMENKGKTQPCMRQCDMTIMRW